MKNLIRKKMFLLFRLCLAFSVTPQRKAAVCSLDVLRDARFVFSKFEKQLSVVCTVDIIRFFVDFISRTRRQTPPLHQV